MTRQSATARAELVRAYVGHWDRRGRQSEELAAVARGLLDTVAADAEGRGRRQGALDAFDTQYEIARAEYHASLDAAAARLHAALADLASGLIHLITPKRKEKS